MFTSRDSDKHWDRFGNIDPYFAVLTDPRFHQNGMTEETKAEFFQSGIGYLDSVMNRIYRYVKPDFKVRRALDFGCGVGRLLVPLSGIATEVVGVDIADSMLKEAAVNCAARHLNNVTFAKSDDQLSQVQGTFNFIHSVIVFQHIQPARGMQIIERLLGLLEVGGVIVLQFPYRVKGDTRLGSWMFVHVPLTGNIYNVLKRRPFDYPIMQANAYNLNEMVGVFAANHCPSVQMEQSGSEYFDSVSILASKGG